MKHFAKTMARTTSVVLPSITDFVPFSKSFLCNEDNPKPRQEEYLERNDFVIEKQCAELERIEFERQHKEH